MAIQKLTPLMQQWFDLKQQYSDYLLLFHVGDFYEMFFDDAEIAAEVLHIVLTTRGSCNGKPVPLCGIPVHAFDAYVPKLVGSGLKIAVCDQMETAEEAKLRGAKSVMKRQITRIITSGTLTEETMLTSLLNNYLMSVFASGDKDEFLISVAMTDISTGEFSVESFKSDEIGEFLSFVISRSPAEIIIDENILDNVKFKDFIATFKPKLVVRPKSFFDKEQGEKLLFEFYKTKNVLMFGDFVDTEISAMAGIINYIKLTQFDNLPNLAIPKKNIQNDFLKIDFFSVKNLEIFESLNANQNDVDSSLFSLIDKTKTSMGKRKLKQMLLSPLTNVVKISNRLDVVDIFFNNINIAKEIRDIFAAIPDIDRIISRISSKKVSPRDVQNMGACFFKIKKIRQLLIEILGSYKENILLTDIISDLVDLDELAVKIENLLVPDAPTSIKESGFLNCEMDSKLKEYKELSINGKKIISDLAEKYSKQLDISNLKIKYNNILGYFIEATTKQLDIFYKIGKEYGFRHKQTLVGGARFTTDELDEIQTKILTADEKYAELEKQLFNNLCDEIISYSNDIKSVSVAIANLDVLLNFAIVAYNNNYVKPIVDDSDDFVIKDGRHPIVEKYLSKKNISFMPNDCVLENDNDGNSKLWLLTGPNMAGKSTFLRGNAIIVIMAQIGMFVPASYCKIGVVNKLYSRVGASDNLARGLSTFMVEMVETATILNQADSKSFVILDEIGRGTATYDGMAIAGSVLEYLNGVCNCRGLFATHYHELLAYTGKMKNVSSHTMDIKEYNDDIIFMYKVKVGEVDKSYGVHVAKLAGLPQEVVERASAILQNLENSECKNKIAEDVNLFNFKKFDDDVNVAQDQKLLQLKEKLYDDLITNLENINIDSLTPKQAILELYELKEIL